MMKTKKTIFSYKLTCSLLAFFLFFCSFSFVGCGRSKEPVSKSDFYFNTVITITLYGEENASYIDDCFKLASHYENLFSNTIADSDISKINNANGTPVTVDDDTIELLQKGIYYGDLSQGQFDITIGKLSSLWDFPNNSGTVPSESDIEATLSTIDYHAIVIDGNEVSLSNPDAMIDLGGIAKGYIADKMKDYLNEKDITSGMINLGGNVLTLGDKPDGSNYNIGIQKPFSDDGTAIASVEVSDETVVSSGVYERYFYVSDNFYHHILNPKTGYPYDNNLLGVTIICPKSVDGDGLSTTCFALGLEDGMKLIESLDDTEAIFITDDYELHTTSGIGSNIPFHEM